MNMGPMSLSDDQSASLEARYVEAMVAHHQASITMAQDGLA